MVERSPLAERGTFFTRVRRFAHDLHGVAAIEFALILPVMLLLYIGGNEISHALTISRKVTHVASTVADLVAQSKSITASDINHIMLAADAIMSPYESSGLGIRVSLIAIDEDSDATIVWSKANGNETPLVADQAVEIPDDVKVADTYLVSAEVSYPYTPTIGYALTGTLNIEDQFFLSPRLTADVKYTP